MLTLVALLQAELAPRAFSVSSRPQPDEARLKQSEQTAELVPGRSLQRELAAGESHSYRITLQAGTYLRLMLDYRGLEIEVALEGPGLHSPARRRCRQTGPTPVSMLSETTGVWQVEVRASGQGRVRGRYEIRVEEARPAVPADRQRLAAERAESEGNELRATGKTEDWPGAIRKYEEAGRLWQAAGDSPEAADALNQLGDVCQLAGRHQTALEFHQQALRLCQQTNDSRCLARSLNGLSAAFLSLNESGKALDYGRQALAAGRAAGDQRAEAQALNNIGEAWYHRGNVQEALDHYRQSLPLWREAGNRRKQAETLYFIGSTLATPGETQQALAFCEEALQLWRELSDLRGQALTLTAMGHQHNSAGEKQKALGLYNQAMPLFQQLNDKLGQARIWSGLGGLYDELGNREQALDYCTRALRLFQELKSREGEAGHLLRIGEIHFSLGHREQALEHFQRALTIFQALPDLRMVSFVLRNLGTVHEALGNRSQALACYRQALALQRERGDRWWEALTLIDLGRLCPETDAEQAVEYFNQALRLSREVRNPTGEALALYSLARAERSRGRMAQARAHIEASLSLTESLRAKVASQDLRSSYLASVRQRYDFYVALLMQLHRQRPDEGFAALALQASERARARSLLELLTEARADLSEGADPELLARERSLQQQIRERSNRQMRLPGGKEFAAEAAALAREIQELTNRHDEVKALIRAQSPRYAALVQPQPLSLAEIQQQVLDRDTLLLEYALGQERSHLWVVAPDSLVSYELPARAEIEAAARRVYELLTARNQIIPQETIPQRLARVSRAEAEYAQAAATLSRMILEPAAAQLGTKRLLIVSEGALQYVPFAALPEPVVSRLSSVVRSQLPGAGRSATQKQQPTTAPGQLTTDIQPLIVSHEIVSLPSASTLAVLRRELAGRIPAAKAVAVLADPVFDAADDRVRAGTRKTVAQAGSMRTGNRGTAPGRRGTPSRPATVSTELDRALRSAGVGARDGSIARLIFSRREAEAILKAAPAEAAMKALDFQASREVALSPELREYRIIHFATHGLLNTQQPELSGILFSLVDEQGRAKDGFLQLHEICNLRLPAELVVLSACQTGLGREVSGEGLVGLVRGFMYAGAARVVASLWKVDDVATAELMKRFYEEMLVRGQTPAAALRAAQVAMWRQPAWQSPANWAAFVIQGEWK